MKNKIRTLLILALTLIGISPALAATPLKVYILAGQSNMDGHASTRTIAAMKGDPEVADLYNEMVDKDGKPIAVDGVYLVHGSRSGKLDASFGAVGKRGPMIGPEYAFGITMKKLTEEPILIIKTAYGGKDLIELFRPPSAGAWEFEKEKGNSGNIFRRMIKAVKDVLADPGKYHPAYDKAAGYEIAGFVWFQGFNDMINEGAYRVDRTNKKSPLDYSEYSRLLALLIRDVRKELDVPELPFVIGVIGVGGNPDKPDAFREAMAAPANMPEFKGTVTAVHTAKYWDHKLGRAVAISQSIRKQVWKDARRKSKEEQAAYRAKLMAEQLTEEELEMMKIGSSNEAYHYLGSAKIYSRIGKAFAEAMLHLEKQ